MNHRYALLALAGHLAAPAATAQKPQAASPLELGRDYVQESVMVDGGAMSVDAVTGATTGLFNLDFAARPGTPEEQARQFLAAYAGLAGLASTGPGDLEHVVTTSGPAGHAVHFRQTVGGVPVLGSEVVVNVTPQSRVPLALLNYRAGLSVPTTAPAVTAEAARATAFAHLGVEGAIAFEETALVVAPTTDGARLAWQLRVEPEAPSGYWEALVDARTGELFRVADRLLYHGGDDGGDDGPSLIPTAAAVARMMTVDATGMVFVPDPLTRTGVTYGTPGYTDGGDADTPQLTAARTAVTLRDVTFDGSQYHLSGPWTNALDWAGPFKGTFPSATADWSFSRSADAFEVANVYYGIDTFMRYINVTLGITVRPFQGGTNGIVPFDAHGFNGADNSSYSGGTARLQFGEGCVDDAEDSDVVIHELGHGIHHWLVGTGGGPSNTDGLSEGFGDYVAVSYGRSLGLMAPTDPEWNWVFKWDGHNECWTGRITNYTATYPSGSAPHARGQHWSTSNLRIWDAIGQQPTDRAVFEGLRLTGTSSTQPQAAQAVLQAARNMGYPQASLDVMLASYQTQGYTVTMPSASEGGPGAGAGALALSPALPNPTTGRATLTLRAGQAQEVEVALFDVLGRRVATLFDGALGAGEARGVQVETAALTPGLYVVRATGAGASAVRTLTVTR